VRVLVLHRDELAVRELVTRHFGSDMALRRHDEHDLALHLYMCAVHESVLRRGVSDLLVRHQDGRVVRALVRHRCTCAVHESVLRRGVSDLLVRHRDGRAGRESVLHRCTYAGRELDGRLHCDHGFRLVFRHLCAVVFRMDSIRHYCAWLHELRRAVIRRDCGHRDRAAHGVHEVREIQPLPPWNLAWHASWQQLFLRQHGGLIQLLAWIQ
jgi:hypothetical protein